MKRVFLYFFALSSLLLVHATAQADETITVTATSSDVSENLDLRMVATLFGQAKDLAEFEQMLNNPDSAYSNLDLNGDGDVDYLRVVETADNNRHLVVIQAVLAKDIYQDVASIFVEKDPESEAVTVQVIGDEYIYGADYIIEPVYIYRPYIYDWFWGPSWVCWHSPFYWGYWPAWWHPYHCIAHHLYWDHMYWHHHYHPICTYRTAYHYHPHYAPMRETVSRADYATRHPERSFATRNASRQVTNARDFDRTRQASLREASRTTRVDATRAGQTRIASQSTARRDATYGSTNVRTSNATRGMSTATRGTSANTSTRSASVSRGSNVSTATRSATTTPSRSVSPATRSTTTSTTVAPTRSASTATRSTNNTAVRSSSSSSSMRSTSSAVRSSSSSSSMRSAGTMSSGSSSMRSSGSSSSSRGGGGSTRR